MADKKKFAALKHQSTTEYQNKIKINKTLQELGQKTNEVWENTPCAKIPSTTLGLALGRHLCEHETGV